MSKPSLPIKLIWSVVFKDPLLLNQNKGVTKIGLCSVGMSIGQVFLKVDKLNSLQAIKDNGIELVFGDLLAQKELKIAQWAQWMGGDIVNNKGLGLLDDDKLHWGLFAREESVFEMVLIVHRRFDSGKMPILKETLAEMSKRLELLGLSHCRSIGSAWFPVKVPQEKKIVETGLYWPELREKIVQVYSKPEKT